MAREASGGAVLLDALGTLLHLEPPAPRLRAALRERLDLEVSEAEAAAAIRTEISYYRAHLGEGRDPAGLAALRRASAQVVREALGPRGRELALDGVLDALLEAITFTPYPDVVPALRELRARGRRLVVVSNWDVSLHEALARTGLSALVDAAVASAELGTAKPDPAIFRRALALVGVEADRALHAGDSVEADVAGALAAGVDPVLVRREPSPEPVPARVPVIASLAELPALL
jgi:putative hydrolase of the HAD superfamily